MTQKWMPILVAVILGAAIADAQVTTGTILGTITDSTGAAVAGDQLLDLIGAELSGAVALPLTSTDEAPAEPPNRYKTAGQQFLGGFAGVSFFVRRSVVPPRCPGRR